MILLAIDPGVHHHGLALFQGQRLIHCALVRGPTGRPALAVAAEGLADRTVGSLLEMPDLRVVAELPQDRGQARVPPADLIALSVVLGWTLGRLGRPSTLISPADWKGSVPKGKHQSRIMAALSAAEATLIPTGALAHNAVDAIGIGLWALGRISGGRKKGVFIGG